MDTYEVESAELTATAQGTPIWMVAMRKPDGTIHAHSFPPSTIEWRMAEYQLDTVEEALDFILHEPWAMDPTDPVRRESDPAARAGMVVQAGKGGAAEPIRLHNAPTIADARAAHRLRIAEAKARVKVTSPKRGVDPLDTIRKQHGVTDEGLREKAAVVDAVRRAARGEAPQPSPSIVIDLDSRNRAKEAGRA